ncbi:MAG: response regulator [Bacteroidetes bacterium]|nr:MAG: response regulator [Bacteroidota bacterium]
MDRLLIEYQCNVGLEAASDLRKLFEQVLLATVHEKNLNYKILLCLSETVTNIVKHSQPKASNILVRFEQIDKTWMLKISDDGGFYDLTSTDEKNLSEIGHDLEIGRGIGLIYASCNQIEYSKGKVIEENCITFLWPINQRTDRARILLVEDQASVRSLYHNYLANSYEVFVAKDGNEALKSLKDQPVDLVLSDINMPMMDGLSLRSELIQKPEYELTPFVFITASEEDEMQARATSLGIDDYIIKPVTKENLIFHIERVLQRTRQIVKKLTNRINNNISHSFTHQIPTNLSHWNIAVSRRDTGAGGGDLLLFQSNKEDSLVALIDIMGHDESAKFFSYAYGGFISGIMRAGKYAKIACHELLQHISEMAYNDELLSKVTLTGIVFNLAPKGKLTMACAAHPHPLMISKESIEAIHVEGILPGLLPDTKYNPIQITVRAGERIAIYTDGLTESAPDNVSRGKLENQILTIIKETIHVPIDRALRLVMQKFDELAGTPPNDDTTFILLEPLLG